MFFGILQPLMGDTILTILLHTFIRDWAELRQLQQCFEVVKLAIGNRECEFREFDLSLRRNDTVGDRHDAASV